MMYLPQALRDSRARSQDVVDDWKQAKRQSFYPLSFVHSESYLGPQHDLDTEITIIVISYLA